MVDFFNSKELLIDGISKLKSSKIPSPEIDSRILLSHSINYQNTIYMHNNISISKKDKNKAKAMKILLARLYDQERQIQNSKIASTRKNQVGTGDRSERIRTYNYPQGRVTDHRINLTLHKIEKIIEGEGLDEIIDNLILKDRMEKLEENE